MEKLQTFSSQLKSFWSQLSAGQKTSFAVVILVSVLGFAWIFSTASAPEWRVLYGQLDEATASRVVEELESRNIRYRLSGTTISVPQSDLYQARLHIASEGITESISAGYELFDKTDFGMTAFTQQVNYKRAMENELARTIRHLRSVREARVHLVLPKEALFKENQQQPSASVVLALEGHAPDAAQIQSIRHLVASAVEGLAPGQVTVVDQNGRLLAKPDGDDLAGMQESGVEVARDMEARFEERITELLAPLVGYQGVRARAHVEIDSTRVSETAEIYDPDQRVARSEQRRETNVADGDRRAAGVAGIGGVLGAAAPQNQAVDTWSNSIDEVTNYEVSKTIRQTFRNSHDIARVHVAVIVDQNSLPVGESEALPLPRIEALVQRAIGFDASRGDLVEISMEPFLRPEVDLESPGWVTPELALPAMRYATMAVLALFLFLFVMRPMVRTITRKEEPVVPAPHSIDVEVIGKRVGDLDSDGEFPAITPLDQGRYPELRAEVLDLSGKDIDKTAVILREWIRTDRG